MIFSVRLYSVSYFYTPPLLLYSYSSLTRMSLQGCVLSPPRKIEWPRLSYLRVEDAELPQEVIEEVLSGCRVLYDLYLVSCWGFNSISSESLHKLVVFDDDYRNNVDLLEISAPCLSSLDISFSPIGKKLHLTNLPSSLDCAEFHYNLLDDSVNVMNSTMELLEKTRHAKRLVLGGAFFEMEPIKRKPMTASHRREKNKNKSIAGGAGDNEDEIVPQTEDVIAPQTEIVMAVGENIENDNERDGEADKEPNNEVEIETEKEVVHEAETDNEKEAGDDSEHGESIGTDDTAASSEDGSDDASNSASDDGVLPPTRPELEVFEYGLYEGGYDHVSNHLQKKIDRGPLKCKQYTAKLLRWDLKRESKEMKQFVTNSCLHPLRESSYKTANRLLISLFVERWHPETASFHMPFGEMTVTLDDVHKLLRLPIVGKPMTLPPKTYNETCESVHKLLGIPLEMVNDELKKNRSMALRTQWLIANLSAASDTRLKVEPVQAARGYLLVLLGCTLFQDRTGDKVSAKYIYFLEDMDTISDWAWGAGTLAYTYHMLGKASMFETKGIACYLTLIEAWIYEHFVNLRPGKAEKIHRGELLPKKWNGGSVLAEKNVYRNMKYLRLELDSMTKADVQWTPYRKLDEDPSDVVWFFGCLSLDNISEPYHPNRVVRQFGRVQSKPCAPIAPKVSSRKVSKTYVAKYDAKEIMFENYEEYVLDEDARGIRAKEEGECTLEYEEWYTSVAITKLNFEMSSDLAGKRKKSSKEGDVVQKAIGMLETYVAKGVKSTKEELLSGCSAVIKVLKGESCKGGKSLALVESSRAKRSKNK